MTARSTRGPDLSGGRRLVLDGPLGTELAARGVATELPLWSAAALEAAPEIVEAIHRDYARAGAEVHTANTFRTQPRWLGDRFERLARRAVASARRAAPAGFVAGSLAPVEDCYRPDLSPGAAARGEHRALAEVLADAGADLALCETFPVAEEAWVAVEEARAAGLTTWLALTAGPGADLMTPRAMRRAAEGAVERGAACVLVNCVPARASLPFLEALEGLPVPLGVYANAGEPDERIGWRSAPEPGAARYRAYAERWWARGAQVVGGCCGTGPAHVRALASR
jgi:S-methylmethionine-dependent homocysteine/selenocysteine methylase